jgi:hypothetical protein
MGGGQPPGTQGGLDPNALGGSRLPEWTSGTASTAPAQDAAFSTSNGAPPGNVAMAPESAATATAPAAATTFKPTVPVYTPSPISNLGLPTPTASPIEGSGSGAVAATSTRPTAEEVAAQGRAYQAAKQGQGASAADIAKQLEDAKKADEAKAAEQVYVPLPHQLDGNWLMQNKGASQYNGINLPQGLDMWNVYGYSDPSQQYATPQGSTAALPQGMKAGDVVSADKRGTLPTMTRALYDFNMRAYGNPYGPQGNPQRVLGENQQSWLMSGGG